MRAFLAAVVLALSPAVALAQPQSERTVTVAPGEPMTIGLAVALMQFDAAQAAGDRAELERLVADDYILIGSDGAMQDKAQFIADFTSPAFDLDPFTVDDMLVRMLSPDVAIVTGAADITGSSNGARFAVTLRFTDVWVQRNGQWQVVSAQTTRVG